MPTSLSNPSTTTLKSYSLTILLLFAHLFFYGQSLTGLWIGSLSNDSTTVRKDQSFEIALTEYNGKVAGYSRSEFIVDDTLYYIVKRVKGTIKGDICQVDDDEIVAFNFRGKLDKGVKLTSTFKRNHSDTSWYLAGTWKTNATKKYYAVTGKINLEEEKDLTASKIFPHLEELNLANDVAFYKERIEGPVIVKLAKPEKIKTEYSTKPVSLASNTIISPNTFQPEIGRAEANTVSVSPNNPVIAKIDPPTIREQRIDDAISSNETNEQEITEGIKKQQSDLPKTDLKTIQTSSVTINPNQVDKKIAENKAPEQTKVASNKPPVQNTAASNKPVVNNKQQEQNTVSTNKVVNSKIPERNITIDKVATNNKKPEQSSGSPNSTAANLNNQLSVVPVKTVEAPRIDLVKQAAVVSGRKSEFTQMVSFKSDSLEVSLYDNGEIDGDTVSVYMNGQVLLAKQGLKASAIKKTIYLAPDQKEFTLVLFAENLGKYPPNTGLLVVHDGEDVYNLRFSSDLQKNAGIIFKRK